jgi:hypothetical protein
LKNRKYKKSNATQLTILRRLLVVFRGDHNQRILAAGIAWHGITRVQGAFSLRIGAWSKD